MSRALLSCTSLLLSAWLISPQEAQATQASLAANAVRQGEPAQAPVEGVAAGPAHKIAGMRGLDIETQVQFVGLPDQPHLRTITLGFPDRARWLLKPSGAGGAQPRRIVYRNGQQAFHRDWDEQTSLALSAEDRERTLMHVEMMRAAFLWPQGLEWEENSETTRSAALSTGGRIEAQLGADGRPAALRVFTTRGVALEGLRQITWEAGPARRSWPKQWDFYASGELVWKESVLRIDPRAYYLNSFFLPADRRLGPDRRSSLELSIQRTLLPVAHVIEIDFAKPIPYPEAQQRTRKALQKLRSSGVLLEDAQAYPLSADGLPVAAWLILAPKSGQDRGFKLPAREAFSVEITSASVKLSTLAELRAAAREAGLTPGLPYLSVLGSPPKSRWRVVLPVLGAEK